jgi:hypothetical protein
MNHPAPHWLISTRSPATQMEPARITPQQPFALHLHQNDDRWRVKRNGLKIPGDSAAF